LRYLQPLPLQCVVQRVVDVGSRGMDKYQQSLVGDFFSETPGLSPAVCHQICTELLSSSVPLGVAVKVEPVDFQGSLSYSCFVDVSDDCGERKIMQFRHSEFDTSSNSKAHSIFGIIVPPVKYLGYHRGLHVYTSSYRLGCPYIQLLQRPEGEPPVSHRIQTATDLSLVFVQGLCFDDSQTKPPTANSTVSSLRTAITSLECDVKCKALLDRALFAIQRNAALIDSLPTVLAHEDLTPFNYLVEPSTGRVTAVLDWDGATPKRVGHNLHFAVHLFGCITLDGWEDYPERESIESEFRSSICERLSAQGIEDLASFLFSMELSQALGLLEYYVPRMENDKAGLWEKFLVTLLQRLSWEK